MAFHVACPITCRRICYCTLGFPRKLQSEKGRNEFLEEVVKLEEFLKDPFLISVRESGTVDVAVPKVVPALPPPIVAVDGSGGDGDELLASAQTKRVALQKRAAAASLVAEDYARRFEAGDAVGDAKEDIHGEQQTHSNVKVMCRLCFSGENEGSERAMKMLSCKTCGKKYHRSCMKAWSQHRDLFHWSSWTCASCRICEVCRRTGDPNKFMFCKRCDAAYHCYCQQPPHKNVSSGPYLCPKHTKCHSCGSSVPGNGLSVRWFLGYTCCDACGRLFVKGNYCPVCLKVYRDSESTPMVCCDICQRWVHCHCDGISDEKYLQFQVERNLQYVCATCRGECYQVRDLEDAVQELWRRKDVADRDLVASLREAVGLPTQEDIFSISPYSDEDESGPMITKNEFGRSLKFCLKGLVDKSAKKSMENGKKPSNKKYGKKKGYKTSLHSKMDVCRSPEEHANALLKYNVDDDKNDDLQSNRSGEQDAYSPPVAGSLTEGICSVNQAGVMKHKFMNEVTASADNKTSRTVKINSYKSHDLDVLEEGGGRGKSKFKKGPKLVIHLGARNKNQSASPRSDGSSGQREQDVTTSNGDKGDYFDQRKSSKLREKEGNMIKIKRFNSEASDRNKKFSGASANAYEYVGKSIAGVAATRDASEVPQIKKEKSSSKHAESRHDASGDSCSVDTRVPSVSHSSAKDHKPLLKLKFKNPYHENQSSWPSQFEDDKNLVKGQRSKRKRPISMDKTALKEDDDASKWYGDGSMEEIMDANWILQKLGKDAVGKRVEVQQLSDDSWHRGTITEVGKSRVSVSLDDGRDKNLELGKQGIRFISQKQRR